MLSGTIFRDWLHFNIHFLFVFPCPSCFIISYRMRICFELLEMLKAHKKGIRRATVNTFGYIATAIGPQDVLHTLLNNLRVQERQNRVCTTVAIGEFHCRRSPLSAHDIAI